MAIRGRRLGDADELDACDIATVDDTQDVTQTWVHPGAVERRTAALARLFEHDPRRFPRRMRMVLLAMVAGDPVCRGDDVDACVQDTFVQLEVGEHAVEGDDIWSGRDDFVNGACGGDPDCG